MATMPQTSSAPATIAVLAPLALLASLLSCAPGPTERVNVVFITCDTLRADRTTPYGYGRDTTPALARMADEGLLAERAYSMSSWTLPSMSMLMTGEVKPLADPAILKEHLTLAESFSAAGYRTAGIVANPLLGADYGYDRGLDHYVVAPAEAQMGTPASEVFGDGLAWLEETSPSGKPFFLWLHPVDPHAPYSPIEGNAFQGSSGAGATRAHAARSLEVAYEGGLERANPERLTDRVWEHILDHRNRYDSSILQFDRQLGVLMEALAARGELENTLIVVTSDHGEGLWQRAMNPDEIAKDALFPALYDSHGAQLFEEQVQVPLVLRGPGVPRGERMTAPVDLVDVAPTVLALADVPVTRAYDGDALVTGGIATPPADTTVVSVCSRVRTITVDGRWRLHKPRQHRMDHDLVGLRLYDLEADPFELSPVDDATLKAELEAKLEEWEATYSPGGVGRDGLSDQQILMLHQLGYGGEAEHVKRFIDSVDARVRGEVKPNSQAPTSPTPSAPPASSVL